MRSEQVAHPSELGRPLMLEAKLERILDNLGVERLELVVVAQNIEQVAIGVPQKLKPRGHRLLLCRLVFRVRLVRLHQQRLRGKRSVEIDARIERRTKLLLRFFRPFRRQSQVPRHHLLERLHVHQQTRVPVLHQTVLTQPSLFQLNA